MLILKNKGSVFHRSTESAPETVITKLYEILQYSPEVSDKMCLESLLNSEKLNLQEGYCLLHKPNHLL